MRISDEPLIDQARERFALQDYYGAIHLLQEITEAGRSFADCHHLLGLCYAMLGQSHRALEHFGKALELNPRYIEAHIHRGILLNDLGQGTHRVSVDLFDLSGKRLMAELYENDGEVFNTVLELSEGIATGSYMLHITVDGERHIERLNVTR